LGVPKIIKAFWLYFFWFTQANVLRTKC